MVQGRIVYISGVEPAYVLRAGAIHFGKPLPGDLDVDALDPGRLRNARVGRPEQPYAQHTGLAAERRPAGPAKYHRARGEGAAHDGLGLVAEQRCLIGR
jgi:hypothetical protein